MEKKSQKEIKIKGYMTFRNGEPLRCSVLAHNDYEFYLEKAPIWQKEDKSVPVVLTYRFKKDRV